MYVHTDVTIIYIIIRCCDLDDGFAIYLAFVSQFIGKMCEKKILYGRQKVHVSQTGIYQPGVREISALDENPSLRSARYFHDLVSPRLPEHTSRSLVLSFIDISYKITRSQNVFRREFCASAEFSHRRRTFREHDV